MNKMLRNLLVAAGVLVAGQAAAQVTFFEHDGFQGHSFTTERRIGNFDRWGFNDKASSAVVRGGVREVCTDARFEGRCAILRPGDYPSFNAMGLNDRISSVREAQNYGHYDNRDYRGYARDFRDRDRYEYRDGWRYDRFDNRWERY
jgi:hypothetical protein